MKGVEAKSGVTRPLRLCLRCRSLRALGLAWPSDLVRVGESGPLRGWSGPGCGAALICGREMRSPGAGTSSTQRHVGRGSPSQGDEMSRRFLRIFHGFFQQLLGGDSHHPQEGEGRGPRAELRGPRPGDAENVGVTKGPIDRLDPSALGRVARNRDRCAGSPAPEIRYLAGGGYKRVRAHRVVVGQEIADTPYPAVGGCHEALHPELVY